MLATFQLLSSRLGPVTTILNSTKNISVIAKSSIEQYSGILDTCGDKGGS